LEHYLRFGVNEPRNNGVDAAAAKLLAANWDEDAYLRGNPDVAAAVASGLFGSGAAHFVLRGQFEGRDLPTPQPNTRICFDPWVQLELDVQGQVKPCCKRVVDDRWSDPSQDLDDIREGASFRDLRRSLLRGQLEGPCVDCHIRPLGSPQRLLQTLRRETGRFGEAELLRSLPLRNLRVEVTSKCNLRCVYCAVSHPDYAGRHMPHPFLQGLLTMLQRQPRDLFVMLNGHGEMTYHPDWVAFSSAIAALGFRTSVITNLAKLLDPAEAKGLASFYSIQVSMDTVDPELLRQTRRHVKLETIRENLERIRAAARADGRKPPLLGISCGVYDANYATLDDLVSFCVAEGIGFVTFWQLVKYDAIGPVNFVEPVESLPADRIRDAVDHLARTAALLRAAGITVEIAGEFDAEWIRLAGQIEAGGSHAESGSFEPDANSSAAAPCSEPASAGAPCN
jgi:molybdenum cofactor biosynthesis enzyme MoaA